MHIYAHLRFLLVIFKAEELYSSRIKINYQTKMNDNIDNDLYTFIDGLAVSQTVKEIPYNVTGQMTSMEFLVQLYSYLNICNL
jgi:hypothetical protein